MGEKYVIFGMMEREIKEIRELLREFTETYISDGRLGEDFARLSPKERVGNMIKLLPYFTMKQSESSKDSHKDEERPTVYLPSLFPEID